VTFQKSKTSLTLSSVSFLKTYSFQLLEFSLLVFFRLSYTSLSLSRSPNRARPLTVAPCWSVPVCCVLGWLAWRYVGGAPLPLFYLARRARSICLSDTSHTPARQAHLSSLSRLLYYAENAIPYRSSARLSLSLLEES